LIAPNGTIYSAKNTDIYRADMTDQMNVQFEITSAATGKWKVRIEKQEREKSGREKQIFAPQKSQKQSIDVVIVYLSLATYLKVDAPIQTRTWMNVFLTSSSSSGTTKSPLRITSIINAEVTKRFNHVICASVVTTIDGPKGESLNVLLNRRWC
jgi:hypothetical protein